MPKWTANNIPDLSGKTALVTGANSGLGLETAHALAARNAHVVLGCRGPAKAEATIAAIRAQSPNAQLSSLDLNLGDLTSIRNAASVFCADHEKLDILCNNAGVMGLPRTPTQDGFEMVFGVNHLGHFAFNGLLLDLIKATPGARVVTVSSLQAKSGKLPMDDLNWEHRRYSAAGAYAQSKLANLSFALELDRRLQAAGIDAISVAAHPGYAATNITNASDGKPTWRRRVWVAMGKMGNATLAQPAHLGALPTLYAATAPDVDGGSYFGPDGLAEFRGYPTQLVANPMARDTVIAGELWRRSEELTGVEWL